MTTERYSATAMSTALATWSDTLRSMEPAYDPIDQIRRDGTAFIRLIGASDLSASIAACPDWSLGDLGAHVAEVWAFWTSIVAQGIDNLGDVKAATQSVPPVDDQLTDVLYDAHVALCASLHETDPATRVWTWTGSNQSTDWVRRRMAQETAVHLWDAAQPTGDPYEVPAVVAADGIDEFLTYFAGSDRRDGELKVGGTVHLHCTDAELGDGEGEWFVSAMKEPAATFTREHRKGDAAIRGRAHDILLWLWRRDAGPVDLIGDHDVARRFRAFSDLN